METINSVLLSFSPEKASKTPDMMQTHDAATIKTEQDATFPVTNVQLFNEDSKAVAGSLTEPSAVPPEDLPRMHLTNEAYMGHDEERLGTEFQAAEEPREPITSQDTQPELRAKNIVHIGAKRHASSPLEEGAVEAGAHPPDHERIKVEGAADVGDVARPSPVALKAGAVRSDDGDVKRRSFEALQPGTPIVEYRPASPEKLSSGGGSAKITGEVEQAEGTTSADGRIMLHDLKDLPSPVVAPPITTTERVALDVEDQVPITDSARVKYQEQLNTVKALKERTSHLQAIYKQDASEPQPQSTRPETLLDEEPLFPIHSSPQLPEASKVSEEQAEDVEFEPTGGVGASSAVYRVLDRSIVYLPASLQPMAHSGFDRGTDVWQSHGTGLARKFPSYAFSAAQAAVILMLSFVFAISGVVEQILKQAEAAGRRLAAKLSPSKQTLAPEVSVDVVPRDLAEDMEAVAEQQQPLPDVSEDYNNPPLPLHAEEPAVVDHMVSATDTDVVIPMAAVSEVYGVEEEKQISEPGTVSKPVPEEKQVLEAVAVEKQPTVEQPKVGVPAAVLPQRAVAAELLQPLESTPVPLTPASTLDTTAATSTNITDGTAKEIKKEGSGEHTVEQEKEVAKALDVIRQPEEKQETAAAAVEEQTVAAKDVEAPVQTVGFADEEQPDAVSKPATEKLEALTIPQTSLHGEEMTYTTSDAYTTSAPPVVQPPIAPQPVASQTKKKRGFLRGPMHKLAKEVKKAFNANEVP